METNKVEMAMKRQWQEYRGIILNGGSLNSSGQLKDGDYRLLLGLLPTLGLTRDELASDLLAGRQAANYQAVVDKGDGCDRLCTARDALTAFDIETRAIMDARLKKRSALVAEELSAQRHHSSWQDADLGIKSIKHNTPRLWGDNPTQRKDYLSDVIERLGNRSGPLIFR
jgi:hypothetical protein